MADEASLKAQGKWDYYNDRPYRGKHMIQPEAIPGSELGIHPAPSEFTDAQIATDPILQFFHYAHLPEKLRATSRCFMVLAHTLIMSLPRNPERTVALRKLLEAKDAAVRANLPAPTFGQKSLPIEPEIDEPVEIGGHDEDRDGPVPFGG
jgi:hypothetical protein